MPDVENPAFTLIEDGEQRTWGFPAFGDIHPEEQRVLRQIGQVRRR